MTIAVNLTGFKKSGKTSLALALGEEFARRGVVAAAVKNTHHAGLDKEATDSAQLSRVYAASAAIAGEETSLFWRRRRYIPDLLPLLDADVVIVEGGKSLGWLPRILLLTEAEQASGLDSALALATWGPVQLPGLPALDSVAALADLILARGFALPGLDCGSCGRSNCRELACEIVAGAATSADCKAARSEVEVRINGQILPLNDFLQRFLSGSIRGMLKECKGYAPGAMDIRLT